MYKSRLRPRTEITVSQVPLRDEDDVLAVESYDAEDMTHEYDAGDVDWTPPAEMSFESSEDEPQIQRNEICGDIPTSLMPSSSSLDPRWVWKMSL